MTLLRRFPAIPAAYRVLFLYIEPFLTIVGAFFAHFRQHAYLDLTNAPSAPNQSTKIPLGTTVVLSQLANLYLLFAINEALVLRSTRDLRVWNTLLSGLLLADFGHLYSLAPLGLDIYWKIWTWNAMDWGNVGFVYLGAASRILFLCGFGLNRYGRNGAVDTSGHGSQEGCLMIGP
ncbi:hypothetical protein K432DRAFT_416495 [Lepidopterella palustris CBS 459.81]|uniref:DUF7704 domain-containing protein n=1 Tax=Lepidopterella palustris CBS 459.81 TaxID=1314670 RepID=A0A8E2EBF8_9PEZI|nr:hypothetical protein K432DRAFT_416495 [Lepidopterella palustris CBS 459.81]